MSNLKKVSTNCSFLTQLEKKHLHCNKLQCIELDIQFTRKSMWFAFIKAFPSVVMVFMSFMSFFIPINEHTARLSVILVPLAWLIYSNRNFVDKSYVVAGNNWYLGCTLY